MAKNRVKVRSGATGIDELARRARRQQRGSWSARLVAACLAAAAAIGGGACGGAELSAGQRQARAHNSQGVVHMDQHNYVRGKEEFEAAARLDPDYPTALANLGIALYSLGQYDSARVALHACLERDADQLQANYTLGLIDHAQGQDAAAALAAFRRVATHDPDDPLVHYYLGRTYAKLGRSDSAVVEFHRAIALDPGNVSSYYALANELRQQGDTEGWHQALEAFNRLSNSGGEGVSSSYQGQGKYAEAVADGRFGRPGQDRTAPLPFAAGGRLAGAALPLAFATAADADLDGRTDLVAGGDSPRLYANRSGTFQADGAWSFALGSGPVSALRLADVDDDGDLDAAMAADAVRVALQEGKGTGRFADSGQALGRGAVTVVLGDADHDGDADVLCLGQALQLWSNDGLGAFVAAGPTTGLAPGAARAAVLSDFDDDRDVDIFVLADRVALYSNNRDGSFSDVAAARGLAVTPGSGRALAVADLVPDGAMDVVVLEGDGGALFTGTGRTFQRRDLQGPPAAAGIAAADLDNDGDLDLLFHGSDGIQVAAAAADGFQPPGSLGLPVDARLLLVEDVDGDGRLDLIAGDQVLINGGPAGRWLDVDLAGLNSQPDGFGAKVEVKTALSWQKRELRGGPGDPAVLRFGLGEADSVEFVRVLWPGGVRQTEVAAAAGSRLAVTEVNRKGTSCPLLFAWDGGGFRFVSDFLGGAIIGYLTAPGQYYTPDTDEYLPLPSLAERDGRYILQVGNQLEEVIYLDGAELVAVDHAAGTQLYANERLLAAPPYPEFRTYPVAESRPPVRAVDGAGRDVTALLAAADDEWCDGFRSLDIHGYAEEHTLVLDLGDLEGWTHPVLLAYGWVDYAHSSSNWAAGQRGLQLMPPRLEASSGGGDWRLVTQDMGCPAGLPKTMLFDLEGVFPAPARQARLRITTSTPIYWDQFLVGRLSDQGTESHRQPFTAADLHWRGYAEHTSIKGTFAFRYNYDRLRLEAPWDTHTGGYTRLGDATELLGAVDDRFAILRHGDELTLQVDAADFPPLAPGRQRTFLFYADGFGKDMDFHSAHSLTVEPLPFHGMTQYPYPPTERYPATPEHMDYVLTYNTRWVEGY